MVSRFCSRCGQLLPTNAATCPRCNAPVPAGAPGAPAGSPPPSTASASATPSAADTGALARRACANCRAPMRWIGHFSLRATGAASGSTPASGPAEGTETLLPFSLYYCQTCGKFDFYYPGT